MTYVGIDIQSSSYSACAVMNDELQIIHTSWLDLKPANIECELREMQDYIEPPIYFGIDAPRNLLSTRRKIRWRSKEGCWRLMSKNSKGHGRHCEVVIKVLDLANPQWTPFKDDDVNDWMKIGFQVFEMLECINAERNDIFIYEVCPTASFKALKKAEKKTPSVNVSFENFAPDQKDMIDAIISAFTVHEFANNRGAEVGNADNAGSIVLPCSLQDIGIGDNTEECLQQLPRTST